jgi:hypothetical protein
MLCPYECDAELDPYISNPLCMNQIDMQVVQIGGAIASLEVAAGVLTLILTNWIMLAAWSRRQHTKTKKNINKQSLKVTDPEMSD